MAAFEAPSASFLSVFLPVARASLVPAAAKPQSFLQQIQQRAGSALNASLAPSIFIPIPAVLGDLWNGLLNAVPKKKTSHMKKRHRQMAGKALKDVTALNRCSSCGRLKQAHTLCPYCVTSVKQWLFQKFKTDLQAEREAHERLADGPKLEEEKARLQIKFESEMEAYEKRMEQYALLKEEYERQMQKYTTQMEEYKALSEKYDGNLAEIESKVRALAEEELGIRHQERFADLPEDLITKAQKNRLAKKHAQTIRTHIQEMPKEDLVKLLASSDEEASKLQKRGQKALVRRFRDRDLVEQMDAAGLTAYLMEEQKEADIARLIPKLELPVELQRPIEPTAPEEPIEPTKPELKEPMVWTSERYERDGRRRAQVSYMGRDSVPRTTRMPKRPRLASTQKDLSGVVDSASSAPDQPRV